MPNPFVGPRPPSAAVGTLDGGTAAVFAQYRDDLSALPHAVLVVTNLQGQAMPVMLTGRDLLELCDAGRRIGEAVAQMEFAFENLEDEDETY